jgi:hypothetical protein
MAYGVVLKQLEVDKITWGHFLKKGRRWPFRWERGAGALFLTGVENTASQSKVRIVSPSTQSDTRNMMTSPSAEICACDNIGLAISIKESTSFMVSHCLGIQNQFRMSLFLQTLMIFDT